MAHSLHPKCVSATVTRLSLIVLGTVTRVVGTDGLQLHLETFSLKSHMLKVKVLKAWSAKPG